MTLALIPAAGKSTRMGRSKLALPLGERTVLEHVIAALGKGGAEHVLVVLGPHVWEMAPLAESTGASVLVLPEETADMRATVEAGLRWLEERFAPRPENAWLLAPADHPTLEPDVVRQLLAARAAHPESSIFIPTFRGERGHPALIAWKHVAAMRGLPGGQGLNVYLRQQIGETLELPVDTDAVLCDLDTPEDYERLRRKWR